MKSAHRALVPLVVAATLMLLSACNLPAAEPTQNLTATFDTQTREAQLTAIAPPPATNTPPIPPTTAAPPPSATLQPTRTNTATPTQACDRAQFVSDVNYPDGTDVAPGAAITKTWRLRNAGTCTWTSGYALVFDHGDAMGAPASTTLTSGTVAPGQTVDVSVSLTMPATAGTYQGYFRLRNPSGVLFGIGEGGTGAFWVKLDVTLPTTTVTLTALGSEDGTVWATGGADPTIRYAGDDAANVGTQAFLSFDISGIPSGSVITAVSFDFTGTDTQGNPFADLGCLILYKHDYGTVDSSDYVVGAPAGGLIALCNLASLGSAVTDDDFVTALQSKVGTTRFQIRAQFSDAASSSDGVSDVVRLSLIKMTVSYHP